MKRLFLVSTILFCITLANAQNPFEAYGYTPKIATLSNGKYNEFHDLDTVVQIGTVLFNTQSKQIVAFLQVDTLYSEATLQPDIVSMWISPDPLADEYPSWSPYAYCAGNPVVLIDNDGRSFGDFINEKGEKIGWDGKYDGKVYIIKTAKTYFDSEIPSAGISKKDAQNKEEFIRQNSGNTQAFEENDIAYKNSVEIEGSAFVRSEMFNIVATDDGNCGTSNNNNREHGGQIDFLGNVTKSASGVVGSPISGGLSIDFIVDGKNYKSRFHSHSSGTAINSEGFTRGWYQAPSQKDLSNSSIYHINYVFGRRDGFTYIYNSLGVIATMPTKSFVIYK